MSERRTIAGRGRLIIGSRDAVNVGYKISSYLRDKFASKEVNGTLWVDTGTLGEAVNTDEGELELEGGEKITISGIRPSNGEASFYVNGPVPGL